MVTPTEFVSRGSEYNILLALFSGIDRVSQIYVARHRRIDFSTLRHDVEDNTGKELSEARLCQILALAAGGIQVHWIGNGNASKLELLQVDENGLERPMTTADLAARKESFSTALKSAVEAGEIPSQNLPPKPESKNQVCQDIRDSSSVPEVVLPDFSLSAKYATVAERRQSTLDRVRARQAANASPEALRYEELRRNLQICHDSLGAFSVMAGLFARRGGLSDWELDKSADAASEPELLKALCSGQALRPMDATAARAAVAYLASKADGWFYVEEGTHVIGAKYYRRLPNSSSADVLDRLKIERSNLEQEIRSKTQPGTVGTLKVESATTVVAQSHLAAADFSFAVRKQARPRRVGSTGKTAEIVKQCQGKDSCQIQKDLPSLSVPDAKRRRVSGKQSPATVWLR